jgi:hypothetical protein
VFYFYLKLLFTRLLSVLFPLVTMGKYAMDNFEMTVLLVKALMCAVWLEP